MKIGDINKQIFVLHIVATVLRNLSCICVFGLHYLWQISLHLVFTVHPYVITIPYLPQLGLIITSCIFLRLIGQLGVTFHNMNLLQGVASSTGNPLTCPLNTNISLIQQQILKIKISTYTLMCRFLRIQSNNTG